jgi:predicted nucleotide-binding protein
MKLEDAKRLLEEAGIEIESESRLANDTGVQLRRDGGSIVNVYDSGKYILQGRTDPRVAEALK